MLSKQCLVLLAAFLAVAAAVEVEPDFIEGSMAPINLDLETEYDDQEAELEEEDEDEAAAADDIFDIMQDRCESETACRNEEAEKKQTAEDAAKRAHSKCLSVVEYKNQKAMSCHDDCVKAEHECLSKQMASNTTTAPNCHCEKTCDAVIDEHKECPEVASNYTKTRDCSKMCKTLCPAQAECQAKQESQLAAVVKAQKHHELLVKRCNRRNTHARKMVAAFMADCHARNEKMLKKCESNADKARDLADLQDSTKAPPALECPLLKCHAPEVKYMKCDFEAPKAAEMVHCAALCSNGHCGARSRCHANNQKLLEAIAHEETVYRKCITHNHEIETRYQKGQQACQHKYLIHIAHCQIEHSESLLDHHEEVIQCLADSKHADWAHCNQLTWKEPTCEKFDCEDDGEHVHTRAGITNCHVKHVKRSERMHIAQRTLAACDHLCPKTFFSKWRGLKLMKRKVEKFEHSKVYKMYELYRKHTKECDGKELCKLNVFRTFRRLITPCAPGYKGSKCRRMRRYVAFEVKKKAVVLKKFKRTIHHCSKGWKGRVCRRVAAVTVRRKLSKCPSKGKFRKLCLEARARRTRQTIKKCRRGDMGKDSWICRSTERSCIRKLSRAKWCVGANKSECLSEAYERVEKECNIRRHH